MAEILLVNPRRRRKATKSRKRRASKRRVARRRKSVAVTVKANPRRRRRSYAAKVTRRRKRNPSMRGITGRVVPTVKAGFVGALGGLGLDVLMGYAGPKLPANLSTGVARHAVKALGAVLVGVIGNYAMRGKGRDLANGAMTIVIHDALKEQVAANFPTIPLGEYFSAGPNVGYDPQFIAAPMSTGISGLGGMGEYLQGDSYGEDDAAAYGGS